MTDNSSKKPTGLIAESAENMAAITEGSSRTQVPAAQTLPAPKKGGNSGKGNTSKGSGKNTEKGPKHD